MRLLPFAEKAFGIGTKSSLFLDFLERMTVIVSSKTQGFKKIGNASRSKAKIISECLYLNGAKNHFLEFSIFSTIHLNMFLNIFHATLGIKLILSKHRTEETNDELMMPLVKRINTYICTYLSNV